MPLTVLDQTAALIVIDLQKGIAAMLPPETAAELADRSAQLARAFRLRGWPVVLVNVTAPAPGRTDGGPRPFPASEGFADLMPELGQQPDDYTVTKQRQGAFLGTGLHETLQTRGATQIFLTGVATSAGIEATARSAYDLGYNVVIVTDAIADRDRDTHQFFLNTVLPRISETTSTAAALAMLQSEAPHGA